MNTTHSNSLQMIRMPEVMRRTGLSRSTIYALIDKRRFPHQIKVSENTAAWLEHEIDAYLQERISMRNSES